LEKLIDLNLIPAKERSKLPSSLAYTLNLLRVVLYFTFTTKSMTTPNKNMRNATSKLIIGEIEVLHVSTIG
jgi:hypothetical protein